MRAQTVLAVLAVLFVLSSCSDDDADSSPDASADADSDTDADTDADSDSDSDCVVFVDGSLADYTGHDGSTWSLAFATVQEGLDGAAALASESGADAGAGCDVWVAALTYTPTVDEDGSSSPVDAREKSIFLRPGVALYGGFAGTEAALDERDVAANETILSGDLGVAGADTDNSYHVVRGSDGASIDGFTITGGNAAYSYDEEEDGHGGGMYNSSASPSVSHCIFSGNTAILGAGMFNLDSSPSVTTCTFSDNDSGYGGGMYNLGSSPTVTNCIFSSNKAQCGGGGAGGGMENVQSSPVVGNCAFFDNVSGECMQTGDDTWDCLGPGGGMNNYDSSSPIVTNCTFVDNKTHDSSGGGMNSEFNSTPTVTSCIFWGNRAGEDGDVVSNVYGGSLSHSDVEEGFEGIGNIDADPLFVSDIDLHLQAGSPCIDTGLTSALPLDEFDLDSDSDTDEVIPYDLDGNPRVAGGAVDMGAYEYQP